MNALQEMILEELRQTEQETVKSLQAKDRHDRLKPILEAELNDIRSALEKMKNGNFGMCEISGELIPENCLKVIPTIKTVNDFPKLNRFYRKPIHLHC